MNGSVEEQMGGTEDKCVYGTLTDSRDKRTYKTVQIGDQWWMAENLNYEADQSFCFNDSAKYCTKDGRLYTRAAAMDSAGQWSSNGEGCGNGTSCTPKYPVRGVCPDGWHLPDSTEWGKLFAAVGGDSTAAIKLKSASGWIGDDNGTDAYAFSALPTGLWLVDLGFCAHSMGMYSWSSTENSYYVYLSDNNLAGIVDNGKDYALSVRCVKD